MLPNPIYIFGSGRSGTNWLLNLMDQHYRTHCRNEPDQIETSLLSQLYYNFTEFQPDDLFGDRWNSAIEMSATHYGERDRMPTVYKSHIYNLVVRLGILPLLEISKARKLLSIIYPPLLGSEWELPWWMGSKNGLQSSIPVLKIVGKHNWGTWLVKNRSNSKMIHIVRHPGGNLNSWKARYLKNNKPEKVLDANIIRLKKIIAHLPIYADYIGDLSSVSVEEAEMWFWRYSNEEFHKKGQGNDNYLLIIYEELVLHLVDELEKIYNFCDLKLNETIINNISKNKEAQSLSPDKSLLADIKVSEKWQNTTSPEHKLMLKKVLQGSIMEKWWI